MDRSPDAPFPFEAVRDLLGVVRAIYAAAKNRSAGRVALAKIARVGRDLNRSLELAAIAKPGTAGGVTAHRLAESAAIRVGDLVDALTPAEPLVIAAQTRVSGARAALRRKTPER